MLDRTHCSPADVYVLHRHARCHDCRHNAFIIYAGRYCHVHWVVESKTNRAAKIFENDPRSVGLSYIYTWTLSLCQCSDRVWSLQPTCSIATDVYLDITFDVACLCVRLVYVLHALYSAASTSKADSCLARHMMLSTTISPTVRPLQRNEVQ